MESINLRERAEVAVRLTRREVALCSHEDIQRLVHDLQVHQVELEMQNESLLDARREVELSQEEYQELFESAPAGYVILDNSGRVLRANLAALTMLRVPRRNVTGDRLLAFVAPSDRALLRACMDSAHAQRRARCELRLCADTGPLTVVCADISVTPKRGTNCLVVLTDISELKRSEASTNRLNEQLEARNRELESAIAARAEGSAERDRLQARLRESDRFESLGLLAAGIAHDFNNLLVTVLGNAELLLLDPDVPDDWRDSLALIKSAGHSAADLTRDLLMFAGRAELNLTAVNLPEIAASALALLQSRRPAGVRLDSRLDDDLPAIEADPGQVNQVLMNLVTNAAEAIDGRGQITVHARSEWLDTAALASFQQQRGAEPGHFVILQVQDSGLGIDAATIARIFDPFFSTKFTGRGLGLASVLGIVQRHRGALRVRTQPGQGTSFEIAFRVAKHAVLAPADVPSEHDWVGSGRLLLIDDDDGVRSVLAQMLRSIGYDVTEAAGGRSGLELFERTPFPLVVLDWLMPGFSGEQVLKALHALDATLPVVLVSGYSAQDFESYGASVVRLQKPMTICELRDALRAVDATQAAHAQ
jgi:PAS domain S-box-containing protein